MNVPFPCTAAPDGAPTSKYDTAPAPAAAPETFTANRASLPSTTTSAGGPRAIMSGGAVAPDGSTHRAELAASEPAVPRAGRVRFAALPLPSAMAAALEPLAPPGSTSESVCM